jgi:repressor LexA
MTATVTAPTARQREIHAWVTKFIGDNGYSPSFRDIGKAFGIKSPNGVVCHLKPMRERGMVTWVEGVGRSLRALESDA